MTTALYRVELDIFSGPLDLLLYLVERSELDIRELPIAKITSQFAEFLEVLEWIDLDLVGDFIVMASTLVEIKSREVLPRPEESQDDTEDRDPRSELIQQLLEYKKFKEAATALEEQAAIWQERFPRLTDDRPRGGKDPSADYIRDVELWDLVSALGRIVKTKTEEPSHANIRYDDTPISVHMDRIRDRVMKSGRVKFSDFFQGENERSRIVGVFLAILELIRHYSFRAEQPADYGEITVLPPLEESEQEPAPQPQPEQAEPSTEQTEAPDDSEEEPPLQQAA
ncbi:segregation and condensation protein A [Thalassoroseus pseudoceratinae]|uniref:segregation and condensation protein A n=1 Tax=Thalassoroseus pseudoceratinae TaxID=2713176 RepID=UPI001422A164|nr:segregation/condensation protein A [Thalassoroseus pseudoceratinae]